MSAWIIPPLPIVSAVGAAQPGFAAENVASDYAGIVWRSTPGDIAALSLDLGSDLVVDTVALFGIASAVGSARIRIRGATTAQGPSFNGVPTSSGVGVGNFWLSPTVDLYAASNRLANGFGVGLWSNAGPIPPGAVRYVYIDFLDLAGGSVQIGRVVVGKRIDLERNFAFGGAFGVRDFGQTDFSNRAVLLRRQAPKLRTIGISFPAIERDEAEEAVLPLLEQLGGTGPVALVTDPAPHPMRERRCYFGPLVGDLGAVWRTARSWEARVNLVSLF